VRLRLLLVIALLAGSGRMAWAADRTDVVTLTNGDRFTGEILNLNRGRVELKTDNAGTIDIEWDNVASIVSRRQFTVTLKDGTRLVGTLEANATTRIVRLGTAEGERRLSMDDITGIEPLGQSFWAKLTGSVGAGFNYTRSSGVSQFTLNSDTTYRRPAFVATFTGAATLTDQSDDEDSGPVANAQFIYERYRGRRWFIAGAAQLETNESLGLTLRSQVGGMLGARLVNSNRSQLQIGAGIAGNQEQGVDVATTKNIEGLVMFKTSYYTYDRPKTNFDATVQYYPSLSNWGRQRFDLDSSVKRELLKDFYVSLNLYDTFDSAPPNPDAARNDVGISLSISWSFGT
jgi:hypothetical protein